MTGVGSIRKSSGFVGILVLVVVLVMAVGTGAYYLGTQKGGGLPSVTTQSPTPSPAPDPTADWEMYTNTKVGFQIKYPPRYNPPGLPEDGRIPAPSIYADGTEDEAAIIFGDKSDDNFELQVFHSQRSVDELVDIVLTVKKGIVSYFGFPERIVSDRYIIVDGVNARWLTGAYNLSYNKDVINFIVWVNKGHGFLLSFSANYTPEDMNQILSTFKFTQ